jgi:hypothetical protein
MFLGLLDPYPDSLVRGVDPDPAPDPFYLQAKIVRKPLIPAFCDLFLTFYLLKMM